MVMAAELQSAPGGAETSTIYPLVWHPETKDALPAANAGEIYWVFPFVCLGSPWPLSVPPSGKLRVHTADGMWAMWCSGFHFF